jgi:hypothetical protein
MRGQSVFVCLAAEVARCVRCLALAEAAALLGLVETPNLSRPSMIMGWTFESFCDFMPKLLASLLAKTLGLTEDQSEKACIPL